MNFPVREAFRPVSRSEVVGTFEKGDTVSALVRGKTPKTNRTVIGKIVSFVDAGDGKARIRYVGRGGGLKLVDVFTDDLRKSESEPVSRMSPEPADSILEERSREAAAESETTERDSGTVVDGLKESIVAPMPIEEPELVVSEVITEEEKVPPTVLKEPGVESLVAGDVVVSEPNEMIAGDIDAGTEMLNRIDLSSEQARAEYFAETTNQVEQILAETNSKFPPESSYYNAVLFEKKTKTPKFLLQDAFKTFKDTYQNFEQTIAAGKDTNELTEKLVRVRTEIDIQINALRQAQLELDKPIPFSPEILTTDSYDEAKSELESRLLYITNQIKQHGFDPTQSQEFLDLNASIGVLKNETSLVGLPPELLQTQLEGRYEKLKGLYVLAKVIEDGLAESIKKYANEVPAPSQDEAVVVSAVENLPANIEKKKTPSALPQLILDETMRVDRSNEAQSEVVLSEPELEQSESALPPLTLTEKDRIYSNSPDNLEAGEQTLEEQTFVSDTNEESAREVHRMTIEEMVERPFTEDELLNSESYNINVRPYVYAALLELGISASEVEKLVTKSLDKIIQEIDTGVAPVQIAKKVNVVISNFHAQFSASNRTGESVDVAPEAAPLPTESPLPGEDIEAVLTHESLLNEINTKISELETAYPDEVGSELLQSLHAIKDAVLGYHEPDPALQKLALEKYQRNFNRVFTEASTVFEEDKRHDALLPKTALEKSPEQNEVLTAEDLGPFKVDDKVFVEMDNGTSLEAEVVMLWPESKSVAVSWIENGKRKTEKFPAEKLSKEAPLNNGVQSEKSEEFDTAFTAEELAALQVNDKVVIVSPDGTRRLVEIDFLHDDRPMATVSWKEGSTRKPLQLPVTELYKYTGNETFLEPVEAPVEAKIETGTEGGEVLDAETLAREIKERQSLSEEDRATALALYENYERMKAEGKGEESLQKMLQSIKSVLDTPPPPVTVEEIMDMAKQMPFVSDQERQNLVSLYENYERMKADGKPEESLQLMIASMKDIVEAPVDIIYLPERAALILAQIELLEKLNPEAAKTARSFKENYERMTQGDSKGEINEDKIRQAYKNLENFVVYESTAAGVVLPVWAGVEKPKSIETPSERLRREHSEAVVQYREALIVMVSRRKKDPTPEPDKILEQNQQTYMQAVAALAQEFQLFRSSEKARAETSDKNINIPAPPRSGRFKKFIRVLTSASLASLLSDDSGKNTTVYSSELKPDATAQAESATAQSLTAASPIISRPRTNLNVRNMVAPPIPETNPTVLGMPETEQPPAKLPTAPKPLAEVVSTDTIYGIHLEDPVVATGNSPTEIFSTHATPPSPGPIKGVELPFSQTESAEIGVGILSQALTTTPEHPFVTETLLSAFKSGTLRGLPAGMPESDFINKMNAAVAALDAYPELVIKRVGIESGNLGMIPTNTTFDAGPILSYINGLSIEAIAASPSKKIESPVVAEAVSPEEVTVEQGDKLFSLVDEKIEPLMQGIPAFEQQALSADIRSMLLELSPEEVRAMGIASGNINMLQPGERINLSGVVDMVEEKTDSRWLGTTPEVVEDDTSTAASLEVASAGRSPVVVTEEVVTKYREAYPGGDIAFLSDFNKYVESVQGADPKGGWLSSIFAPDAGKANAYEVIKNVRVYELQEADRLPKKERLSLLRDKNIRVADFEAWMKKIDVLQTTGLIKSFGNLTLEDACIRGFISQKLNGVVT